jgi:hypothetical protein
MPSDGLFDMEWYSLLSAHTVHRSSPASRAARGGSGNVDPALSVGGSEVDMASVYSDSAPARECFFLDALYNVY